MPMRRAAAAGAYEAHIRRATSWRDVCRRWLTDLNVCSKKGLSERFDSTIGAGTVLMPFGGAHQLTPTQAMVAKIPVLERRDHDAASLMAWGFNPYLTEKSPYHGAYLAVVESRGQAGGRGRPPSRTCYLTFQEYFEQPGRRARALGQARWRRCWARWTAQMDLGIGRHRRQGLHVAAASSSCDVPPTLVSFAVAIGR